MAVRALILALVLTSGAPAGAASTPSDRRAEAARHFAQGQAHFAAGRFKEAIAAFSAAQRLAPHPFTLFNIARAHQNLGDNAAALRFYRQALALERDPRARADLTARIARLASTPVKVFLSTVPPGATVTVDGRAHPEPGRTPLVLKLVPGEHLLLLRRKGFLLRARRVVVEVGRELAVQVTLSPRPTPPSARAPCPTARPCPPPPAPLLDTGRLHLQLGAGAAFAITTGRPTAFGPSFQLRALYRRLLFGAILHYFPFDEQPVDAIRVGGITYDRLRQSWFVIQAEGGYTFPFGNFLLYASATAGISADRLTFVGKRPATGATPGGESELIKEALAFTWGAGGGVVAAITRWLTVGMSTRFSLHHGRRADRERPGELEDRSTFPVWLLWSSLTLRL